MARQNATFLAGKTRCSGESCIDASRSGSAVLDFDWRDLCCLVQVPMFASKTIPKKARNENHARLDCPLVSTKAARSGPSAEPALPPTWKSDCAMPCCPPEAMRATREDSG